MVEHSLERCLDYTEINAVMDGMVGWWWRTDVTK